MTAVGAPPQKPDIDSLYSARRGDLYRALVLITEDRDHSVEAIDRAFSSWAGRWRSTDAALIEPDLLGSALRWVRRRTTGRNPELRGFRLPAIDPAVHDAPDAVAFRRLDIDDRAAIVGRHLFRWDAAQLAMLTASDEGDAQALADAAESRLRRAKGSELGDVGAMLSAEAAALREPLSRLEATKARGRVKKISTALAGLLGAAALVGGAVVAVGAITADEAPPGPELAAPGSTGAEAVAGTAVAAPPADLTWTQTSLPIREGNVSAVAHGPNGFIVVANDYSGRGPSAAIFQSEDGLTWEQIGAPPVRNEGWIQSIQFVGGQYLAIGTEFNERTGQEAPKVWVSTDGFGWSESVLPVDTEVEIDGQVIPVYTYLQSATGADGELLVIGGQHAELDPERMLRDLLPEGVSASGGWGSSPNGIELYDNRGNVTFRGTWEELGVDAELAKLLAGNRTVMWTSEDGVEWQPAAIDIDVGFEGGIGRIAVAGDLRAAQVWAQFGAQIWIEADDGWQRASIPGAASVNAVGSSQGRIVATGSDDAGAPAIWSTEDGISWERATGEIPGPVHELFGTGDALLALAQVGGAQVIGPAVFEVDGYTIEAREDGSVRVLDGDEEIATVFIEEAVNGPDGSVTIIDDEGNEVVSFFQSDVERAWEEAFRALEVGSQPIEPGGPPPTDLLMSSDGGRTWSSLGFSAQAGQGFYPSGAAWNDGTVVVAGFSEGEAFRDGPPPVVVWAGTSAG